MRRGVRFAAMVCLMLGTALVVNGQEKPKKSKLVKPWADLTSLNDDQKAKIYDIHQKSLADIRAIRDKEEADIMALLTDEQKAELKKNEESEKAEAKAKRMKDKEKDEDADKGDKK